MSKRSAIIALVILLIAIIALLSVAAYTVKSQNLSNISETLTAVPPAAAAQPSPLVRPVVPATQDPDAAAADGDSAATQYKTLTMTGFSIEVPLRWNSLTETTNNCSIQDIVNGSASISIWPAICTVPGTFAHTAQKGDYVIASNYASGDIASQAVYEHIIATFTLIP